MHFLGCGGMIRAPLPQLVVFWSLFMSQAPIYRVVFMSNNKVYELYAKAVFQSDMYGFIEIEDFVFGERAQVIVDPSEEKLKNEFAGVRRTYVPIHNLLRIDEVEKEGTARIREATSGDKVTHFPVPGAKPAAPESSE